MKTRDAHVKSLDPSHPQALVMTPEQAGWLHLTFCIERLAVGHTHADTVDGFERVIVVLSGDAELTLGHEQRVINGRKRVFDGLPYAMYVPPGVSYQVRALTAVELAFGQARAEGRLPPRFITPDDVKVEMRGGHNVTRQITHIIDPGEAEKLLCVEVYTPSGNWSSYPPHRHDEHVEGVEVDLDEIYHYRIDPPDGWAMQRLYTDARDLDDVVLARDGDTVMVRRGYHPVVMAPGYDGYYLNFLAGEHPSWVARDEPQLAWVRGQWAGRSDRMVLPLKGVQR